MKALRTRSSVLGRARGRLGVLIVGRSGKRTQAREAAIERVERFALGRPCGFDRTGEGAVNAGALALRRRGVFIPDTRKQVDRSAGELASRG